MLGVLIGTITVVLKRSVNNVRLLLATFLGLVIAVSLISAVPLYTHGTLERLLQQKLTATEKRPPGVVWIRALLDAPEPNAPLLFQRLDDYIVNNIEWVVSVPLKQLVRYIATDVYVLWPAGVEGDIPQRERRYGYVAYQTDLMDHIKIVEGAGLPSKLSEAGEDIPAIISTGAADELRLKVGERYIYSDVEKFNPTGITLKVVGLWDPTNPDDEYWVYDPLLFTNVMFVNEGEIFGRIVPEMPKAAHEFSWYGVFDHSYIHSTNAGRVLSGLQFLETRSTLIFPTARLHPTLSALLEEFERRAFLLNVLLFALSVPMVAIVLYYITTSISMVLERQRGEIALLKSRGASTGQIVLMYALQAVLMGVLAMVVGPIVGVGIAQLIGNAYGFMQFAQRPALLLSVNTETLQYAGVAIALSVVASTAPAIGAARHSIISYKQEVARSGRRPFYQRFFIDIALFLVTGYLYYMLTQRQSIVTLSKDEQIVMDPLLLVAPAVFIFAAALLFLRIFPLITALMARMSSLMGNPAIPLALRQIARTPNQYMSLVLLLTLTLALGSYSASAAHTIDRNLSERVYYQIPADMDLWEAWDYNEDDGTYYAPPFQDHYVDGVVEASPYRSFKVTPSVGRNAKDGILLAIDRLTYPAVGWWRRDFSPLPLGALLNALGSNESATIVSPDFLSTFQLRVGDSYTLQFDKKPVDFFVAETTTYFPTMYPEQGYFFIANIDYVYDQIGMQPYRVWLKIEPGFRSAEVVDQIRDRQIKVVGIQDSRVQVNLGRTDPQRTGLFGMLTVGFAVAALLTVLGFFLYSFLSFERRLVQMGILRAMGLSVRQLFTLLLSEQVFLIALGVAAGTGLGVLTGSMFIPFLQVGAENQTPKFVVETAWTDIARIYGVMGLMLLAGLGSTALLIRRMKLYQSVKMGEEQ
jgi:putative ABC transport system permease protein